MQRLDKLPNGMPIWQDSEQFKFTLDAVLLAAFPLLHDKDRVMELGCGTGAVSLLISSICKAQITTIDNNNEVLGLFEKSISINKKNNQISACFLDVKNIKDHFKQESFSVVLTNPPYRKVGHGRIRQGAAASACHEVTATSFDFIKAAKYLLKFSGKFFMVHLTERLSEMLCECTRLGLEPKKLQFISPVTAKEPTVFLLEAVHGAKPGLKIMPQVHVYNDKGEFSEEILMFYQKFGNLNEDSHD